ncbi:MAG TPA: DNA internalization-related competence protein ComEC/Rec2 [Rudaea sp.]|nr:DNA internalization-related competence protein ComEC/Rec2 [Rudaea sp.]
MNSLAGRLGDLSKHFSLLDLFRPVTALALLVGAVAVQLLTELPPMWVDVALIVCGLPLCILRSRWRLIGFVLLAAGWSMLRGDHALSQRLPHTLEGQDIVATGAVRGLPRAQDRDSRFEFDIASAAYEGRALALHGRVRLSWYEDAPVLQSCEHWRLRLRLKRPRGMIDPGGFDFERFALERGIVATGYVREDSGNRQIGTDAVCVDRLRARIGQAIDTTLAGGVSADLLRALAFGDQQAMDDHEWAVARATGIPHLIAISGLHIALFASFGIALVRLLWKLAPRLTLHWPAPFIEAAASLIFAVAYATLAGLGLPTRRALVMIAALLVANLARRARAPAQGLALAVIVLLAWDPLCVLSAGFWLSFVGVGWLMFCLGGTTQRRRWVRELITAQGVASLGLLPLCIWFFGQSSLIGPLANLVAVPVICFFILPVTVVAVLLLLWAPTIGAPLLHIAGWAMDWLWMLLEKIAAWPLALWYFPEPSVWALLLALLGAFWVLLPRGVPARALGIVLLLPLLWPARQVLADGDFEAYMLDVGQGLSLIVRTRDHALVYDAGARYPSGFDLGSATVVPALHALGIDHLDRMIISHGDNDHAGGAAAVAQAFRGVPVESGEPGRLKMPASQCLVGEHWNWNGVSFRVVHPTMPLSSVDNDRCCVLDIRSGDNELLLTGDITATVEEFIATALKPVASQLVLQVAHHGSKTSSSDGFLHSLHPSLALVSAGYHNHFHHPAAIIVARYAAHGINLLNTAPNGFVDVRFVNGAPPKIIERGRIDRHPYWRE